MNDEISKFLSASPFAVAGASTHQHKYGNQIFRALVASGRNVFPLNPFADEIEGHPAYANLVDLPAVPEAVSIVTPPQVTRQVVADAVRCGVKHLWMQPGAEDREASRMARDAGLTVIDDGSCVLVLLARE